MRSFDSGKFAWYREVMASLAPQILSGDLKVTPTVNSEISVETLRESLGIIEAKGQKADVLFVGAWDFSYIRKRCRDALSPGYNIHLAPHCDFDDVPIFVSRVVPQGRVWFLAKGCLDSVYEMRTPRLEAAG